MEISNDIIRAINNIKLQNTDLFTVHWFMLISGKKGQKAITRKKHHHKFIQMHLFLKGYTKYKFGDEIITANENQYLLISELEDHQVIDISDDFIRLSIGFELATEDKDYGYKYIHSDFGDEITDFINYTINQALTASIFSNDLIRNKMFDVLINTVYQKKEPPKKTFDDSDSEDVRLLKAKQFITDNLSPTLSCKDIADYCFLSERQLNRIFLKYEAMTLVKYVHTQKLKTAKELLKNTNMNMKEISEKSGFSNEFYFNRFFRENAGMPPKTYRHTMNKSKG